MSGQQCSHNLSEEDAIVHTGTADAQELGIETLQVWQVQQVRADQCAEGAGDVSDDLCSARSEYFSQERRSEWRYKWRQHNPHRPAGPSYTPGTGVPHERQDPASVRS